MEKISFESGVEMRRSNGCCRSIETKSHVVEVNGDVSGYSCNDWLFDFRQD